MNGKARQSLQQMLVKAGYLGGEYSATGHVDKDFVKGFVEMLAEYSRSNEIPETVDGPGGINSATSWMFYLNEKARANESASADAKLAGFKAANPPKVELINYNMAAPAYKEAFRSAVGRDPTENEINAFVDSYNAKAKASPLVTNIEMVDGVQVISQTGGVSGDFTSDQIEENADYANYQAVGNYFPLMERILGGGPELNLVQGI
jgi:hypothetical protein